MKPELVLAVWERMAKSRDGAPTKVLVEEVLEAFVGVVKDSLISGENVRVFDLGTFEVKDQAARMGRNPATGEKLQLEASRGIKFKVLPSLKKAIKG